MQFQLADLYLGPAVEDYAGAAAHYEKAIAAESRRAEPRDALYRAQLGLASAQMQQWRLDDSVRLLTKTIDAAPPTPAWVLPSFLLRRANYRGLVGDGGAIETSTGSWGIRSGRIGTRRRRAQTWTSSRAASGESRIYAALLRGNRLAAERKWDEAAAAYEPVRRDHPGDPQVRYRLLQLQFTRGDAEGAPLPRRRWRPIAPRRAGSARRPL